MASWDFEFIYHIILSQVHIRPDISIPEIRALFEKLLRFFPPDPEIEIQETQLGRLSAMKCSPPEADSEKIILFFPGGAYNSGSCFSHRDLMGKLAKVSSIPVMGVNYRLAPEDPYPAAVQDALYAYQWLLKSYPSSKIVVAGLSAGGGLSLALLLSLKEKKIEMPAAAVCICPWVDLAVTGTTVQSNAGKDILPVERLDLSASIYCGNHSRKEPLISPLYGDLSGLPPLFIQVGERELLLDEITRLAKKAKEEHVAVTLDLWPEMFHGWQLFAKRIPEGREAIEKIGQWIQDFFNVTEF